MNPDNVAHPAVPENLLGTYWQFLRSPDLSSDAEPLPLPQILRRTLRLYSLHLLILLVLGVIISQVIHQQDSLLPALFGELPPWFLLTMAVVVAPLIEEIIFRLPLQGTVFTLTLAVSVLVWSGIGLFIGFGQSWIVLGVVLASVNLYLGLTKRRKLLLQGIYSRYPRFIFYNSALLFGAVHITNYGTQVWPLLPLLVSPQIIIGFWLGFVRLRYGFAWAVAAHGFHNGCVLLPILLLNILGSAQLRTQGLSGADPSLLPISDQLLLGAIGLYFLGGIILCVVVAWGVIREKPRVN